MTAYDIFDAAEDNALYHNFNMTAGYFQSYAYDAMDVLISDELALTMERCFQEHQLYGDGGTDDRYRMIEKPLKAIEVTPTRRGL
jgi:hypothetical protein